MPLLQIQGPTAVSTSASRSFQIEDITALTNGTYALSWMGTTGPGGGSDVMTTVFGPNGLPIQGATIVDVSASPSGNDYDLVVQALSNGNYALAWEGQSAGGQPMTVYTAVYGPDGKMVQDTNITPVGFGEPSGS